MVLFLFLLGVAFSGFASYQSTLEHHGEEVAIDAEKLAQQNCASCHGKDLNGSDNAPSLVERGSLLSEETIASIIRDGVGDKMPAGVIKNEKEILAVAKYITSLEK